MTTWSLEKTSTRRCRDVSRWIAVGFLCLYLCISVWISTSVWLILDSLWVKYLDNFHNSVLNNTLSKYTLTAHILNSCLALAKPVPEGGGCVIYVLYKCVMSTYHYDNYNTCVLCTQFRENPQMYQQLPMLDSTPHWY
jgi:hypothetical protein